MTDVRRARAFLRGELLRRGLTLRDIAERHGWRYETLRMVIFRHWGRNTSPRGSITCEILDTLNRYISHNFFPDFPERNTPHLAHKQEKRHSATAKDKEVCNGTH